MSEPTRMTDYRPFLYSLAAILTVLAVCLHAPGQLSYDSVMQLYEASVSRSVGWQPPFMSALLGWLGGGTIGSSIFVALNSSLTYGAFVVAIKAGSKLSAKKTFLCSLLILNPVTFAYVGIVWKDVLFGAWIAATFVLCIVADRSPTSTVRVSLLACTLVLLGIGALIRQQGVFVAPILLVAPLWSIYRTWRGARRVKFVTLAVALFICSWATTSILANRSVVGNNGRSMSDGPGIIQIFDIAGIIAHLSTREAIQTFPGLSVDDYDKVREHYSPERGDFLNGAALQQHLQAGANGASLTAIWAKGIGQHPAAYASHRIDAMMALLDMRDAAKCVPTYVGISGPHEYLLALNLREEVSERAGWLYGFAHRFFNFPIWRNWFYVIVAGLVTIFIAVKKTAPNRFTIGVYLAAIWAFIASFFPTGIACDFRYLYPIVPPLTAIILLLLAHSVSYKRQGAQ